jgi:hypothetical protein
MALFKIFKGPSDRLQQQKAKEGFAYFTPDDGKFYIDITGDGLTTTPVIGDKIQEGVNRVCINNGGFMEGIILNCGTAINPSSITPDFEIIYLNLGDSLDSEDDNILLYDSGNSFIEPEDEIIITFDSGNSYI